MTKPQTEKGTFVVIGASGGVGKSVLSGLVSLGVDVQDIVAVHSGARPGARATYGENADIPLVTVDKVNFTKARAVITCVPESAMFGLNSYLSAFRAQNPSAPLIDASGYFALDPKASLVVPHMTDVAQIKPMVAIAHPIVSGVVHALAELSQTHGIEGLTLSTYEGVSVEGGLGMAELMQQTKDTFMNRASPVNHFPKSMAFNTIPSVGKMPRSSAETPGEEALRLQLCKHYRKQIPVSITRVLVPAFVGVGISLTVNLKAPVSKEDLVAIRTKGVRVISDPQNPHEDFATHHDGAGDDFVSVGRRRINQTNPRSLQMWVMLDNLRWAGAVGVMHVLGVAPEYEDGDDTDD